MPEFLGKQALPIKSTENSRLAVFQGPRKIREMIVDDKRDLRSFR
jgi:hypothetical protein